MPHATISQFLLEFIACIFNSLAGSLNCVYADTDVPKAFSWLRIAIGRLEFVVILSAVVMGQFWMSVVGMDWG